MIYQALRAFLLADAAISASVGTRIYPVKLPQQTAYPAILMTRITGIPNAQLHGKASIDQERWQIDCIMKESSGVAAFDVAQRLAADVRARLESYVGDMIDASVSPYVTYKTSADWLIDRDLYESDVNGGFHRNSADYQLWRST